jgi:Spermine/spermidine synthase domain
MKLFLAAAIAGIAITIGFTFQDVAYRLHSVGYGEQHALDHRDSAYSSITWVVSETDNFQQLRFFDRVEGGICLRPTWDDLITLAAKDPSLSHLVPAAGSKPSPGKPAATWPFSWTPNPGTVTNSPYIRLFPIGVLMNQALMAKTGGDISKVAPNILVIGLGSGIGIANLAYHFPQASITVVDIDHVVEDMVKDHYPFINWLLTQKRADGAPRLRFDVRDARQYIRYDAKREAATHPYDLVILDAYTSGSTIPPHLMTKEFFAQCADIMNDDGILFANVIGSYTGEKRLVSGGAMRSFRAAGLTHLWNFPVVTSGEGPGSFVQTRSRNNIIICSRKPLDPSANAAGWERLKAFVPYPQLSSGMSVSTGYVMANMSTQSFTTAMFPAEVIDALAPNVKAKLSAQKYAAGSVQYPLTLASEDRTVIDQVLRAVDTAVKDGKVRAMPFGWNDRKNMGMVQRRETDWVLAARETFRISVLLARDPNFSGEALVGPLESERSGKNPNWIIAEAPLFTDQMPNADIFNN